MKRILHRVRAACPERATAGRRDWLTALIVLVLVFAAGSRAAAATWYVKGDAAAGGDGSRNRPFATLEHVETASDVSIEGHAISTHQRI
jgi:hypothetical protein